MGCFLYSEQYFYISIKIAVPIVFIILITDLTLGLVARTVPQLNIMILGLPIKILVGLTAFVFALPLFLKVLNSAFGMLPDAIRGFYKFCIRRKDRGSNPS